MSMEETSPASEAWNVADGYVKLKILLPLVECDKLIKIAIYGTEDIENSFVIDSNSKNMYRIESIKRLADTLKSVIDNTHEICLKGQKILGEFDTRLDEVQKFISAVSSEKIDDRNQTKEITINDQHFNQTLAELRKIKREIIKPLIDAGLIFPISDEIDLDKMKKQLIHGG